MAELTKLVESCRISSEAGYLRSRARRVDPLARLRRLRDILERLTAPRHMLASGPRAVGPQPNMCKAAVGWWGAAFD